MCGIAGFLHFDQSPISEPELRRAVDALAHRGPDGQGIEIRGPVGLGHRRLSIIDLVSGAQPMWNEDASVGITFNGEIYNFKALADELEALGHAFTTHSDTEVIVHAWEQWGEDCVNHLRGMFAFAIADWKRRVVFLARDHFGIKPLYFSVDSRRMAFASELQAFHALSGRPMSIDLQSVDDYLALQYVPPPRTIYREVSKLAPATSILFGFDGATSGARQYWDFEFEPETEAADQWAERFEDVVNESVSAHLVADVPFGMFLSGGLDSSLVAGAMAGRLGSDVKAFTIGFDEDEFSEVEYARVVAKRWGLEHHVEIVRPDAVAVLPSLVKHYGEPFGDSSAIATYYVSALARRHVPMVLSGDGGDEALGGYANYARWLGWLASPAPRRPLWKQALRPIAKALRPDLFPEDTTSRRPTPEGWQAVNTVMPPALRRRLWRPEHRSLIRRVHPAYCSAFVRANHKDPLSQARYTDFKTYLPGDILTKVDIASMAHGLEVRTPLIDRRFVEFASTVPLSLLMDEDSRGVLRGKKIMRQVLRRHFDDSFINRKKMGFGVPVSRWFAAGGALRPELERRFSPSNDRLAPLFEPSELRRLVNDHGNGADLSAPIWLLYFLDHWIEAHSGRSEAA